jgi:peroxiredoxin family protein
MKNDEMQTETLKNELEALKASVASMEKDISKLKLVGKSAAILVFSNDYDRLMLAFSQANTLASLGVEVHMWFAFWGVVALKKETLYKGKSWINKIFSFMLPCNINATKLSNFQYMGMGKAMLKSIMKKNNMPPLSTLLETARDLNVKLSVCMPSLKMFGIQKEELIDGVSCKGAADFLVNSGKSQITWII